MTKLQVRNRNKDNKSANYEYFFETARVDGKRSRVSKCGYKTKKEAYEAGMKALLEYTNSGKVFEPSNISVSDYCDYWIKNYVEKNLAYKSILAYTHMLNNYVKPTLGNYYLKNIDTMSLQTLFNDLVSNTNLSGNYVNSILKVVKGAFKYAKHKAKFIRDNPAEDVEMPKYEKQTTPYHIFSKDELTTILDRFKNSPYIYYAILTGYYTGLRVSEVYALTWNCVDFENKTITINKAVHRIETPNHYKERKEKQSEHIRSSWCLTPTKTTKSVRTIKVGDTLINLLLELKLIQEQNKQTYQNLYIEHCMIEEKNINNKTIYRLIPVPSIIGENVSYPKADLIFTKENGSFDGTDAMKYVSKICNHELKIKFNFHQLRHNHATTLIENGASMRDVQERLGHSNILITMNTYVNNTEKMKDESVRIFEENSSLSLSSSRLNKLSNSLKMNKQLFHKKE